MMDRLTFLLEPLDLYCERTDTTLFSEPLNFLTNMAFVVVAIRLFGLANHATEPGPTKRLQWLAIIALAVGLGSGWYHLLPNRLTQTADVVPIALFVALCVLFYFRTLKQTKTKLAKPLAWCLGWLVLAPLLAKLSARPALT